MISISSLCHSVKGNFIVEIDGLGAACFLNIKSVSLGQVVKAIFRKFRHKYPVNKFRVEFIHFYSARGMPRFVIKL